MTTADYERVQSVFTCETTHIYYLLSNIIINY